MGHGNMSMVDVAAVAVYVDDGADEAYIFIAYIVMACIVMVYM